MSIVEILQYTIVGCTLLSWYKPNLQEQLLHDTHAIRNNKEWYRLITSAFVHADVSHLFFNVVAFRIFGMVFLYQQQMSTYQEVYFLALFFGGVLLAGLISQFRHANNPTYRALGASAGVKAVFIATALAQPTVPISLIMIPIPIPIWILVICYLSIDFWLRNRPTGIGHRAHLAGACYGALFALYLNPNVFAEALEKIMG